MATNTPKAELFTKLMMLSTSCHDQEALAALRKANDILAQSKVSWAELLDALSRDDAAPAPPPRRRSPEPEFTDVEPFADRKHRNKAEIELMFTVLRDRKLGSFQKFVDSVHGFWIRTGFLTTKQYDALRKAAQQ
jgi:hypothetical protein